jgi:hypothetical protein
VLRAGEVRASPRERRFLYGGRIGLGELAGSGIKEGWEKLGKMIF